MPKAWVREPPPLNRPPIVLRSPAPVSALLLLAGLCGAGSPVASAQEVVKAEPVPPSGHGIVHQILGSIEQEPLEPLAEVATGDTLFCTEPGGSALLSRGEDVEVTLPCPFRVMVALGQDRLVIALDDGTVFVDSEQPTGVKVGDQMIGSGSTHYSVQRQRPDRREQLECLVYEGVVRVQATGYRLEVPQGKGWTAIRGRPPVTRAVKTADVERAAAVYTRISTKRMEVGRSAPIDAATRMKLHQGYTAVLSRPGDPEAKRNLEELRVREGLARSLAVSPELRRIETPPNPDR